jgi:hypothetical protein
MEAKENLGERYPPEVKIIFQKLKNLDSMADLASYAFCNSPTLKQKLLETLDSFERMALLNESFRQEIAQLKLNKQLQGELPDDDINSN